MKILSLDLRVNDVVKRKLFGIWVELKMGLFVTLLGASQRYSAKVQRQARWLLGFLTWKVHR